MDGVLLTRAQAQTVLQALESGDAREQRNAAKTLHECIRSSKHASSRRRAWFLLTRLAPILLVWGFLARLLYTMNVLTLLQAVLVVAAGAGACLLLPSIASVLLWLPLAALQYIAVMHLVATCAFPSACGSCNWFLSNTLGKVNMQQLQELASALVAWLPAKLSWLAAPAHA
jgi:hypothetical protein